MIKAGCFECFRLWLRAFQYDPAAMQTLDYESNGLNQYETVQTLDAAETIIQTQPLSYDANGSLTGDGVWPYSYDGENRLIKAAKTGTSVN